MLRSNGVEVRLAIGGPTGPHYRAVQRNTSGTGKSHAKFLRVGPFVLVGSTNWTTASKGNAELNTLTHLTPRAMSMFDRLAEDARSTTTPLDEALAATDASRRQRQQAAEARSQNRVLSGSGKGSGKGYTRRMQPSRASNTSSNQSSPPRSRHYDIRQGGYGQTQGRSP